MTGLSVIELDKEEKERMAMAESAESCSRISSATLWNNERHRSRCLCTVKPSITPAMQTPCKGCVENGDGDGGADPRIHVPQVLHYMTCESHQG